MLIPQLVAHRGWPRHYPENTLIGIEAAINAGARYIEVDVQLSADRVPVLFHDRNLDRLCRAPGSIHEFTREQLREFRVLEFDRFGYRYAQTPIATLAELAALLARHPQVHAFIEIKRVAIEHSGVPAVLDATLAALAPVMAQCTLISYSVEFLRAARRNGYPSIGVILEKWRHRHLEAVRAMHPEFFFCDAVDLPRWGRLRAPGALLAVYEITDARTAIHLAKRGVDLIETFAVGEMLADFELLRTAPA